jgi:response regulator RpfG family c-di-GMP phosphodiesterase
MSEVERPRILLVDDEPNVLDALRRQLRRDFTVEVANGGQEGLTVIREHGPFVVVMSDFRMPGMDGAAFLAGVRKLAPETTRVLLTGQADLAGTAAVVNEGQVFRLLLKPIGQEELTAALHDSVAYHNLRAAERVLLEQTLQGSVKALMDVLALSSPAVFARSTRIRRTTSAMLDLVQPPDRWAIDLAAALDQVGAVSLPPAVTRRIDSGLELTAAERGMVDAVPEVTGQLLAHIPRLEPVREIIRYSTKNFDGTGLPQDSVAGEEIPLGARILRVVHDFDDLTVRGTSDDYALTLLQKRSGRYDPALMDKLTLVVKGTGYQLTRMVRVAELQAGMILEDDIRTGAGTVLVSRGQEVTGTLIARVRNFAAMPDGIAEPIEVRAAAPVPG